MLLVLVSEFGNKNFVFTNFLQVPTPESEIFVVNGIRMGVHSKPTVKLVGSYQPTKMVAILTTKHVCFTTAKRNTTPLTPLPMDMQHPSLPCNTSLWMHSPLYGCNTPHSPPYGCTPLSMDATPLTPLPMDMQHPSLPSLWICNTPHSPPYGYATPLTPLSMDATPPYGCTPLSMDATPPYGCTPLSMDATPPYGCTPLSMDATPPNGCNTPHSLPYGCNTPHSPLYGCNTSLWMHSPLYGCNTSQWMQHPSLPSLWMQHPSLPSLWMQHLPMDATPLTPLSMDATPPYGCNTPHSPLYGCNTSTYPVFGQLFSRPTLFCTAVVLGMRCPVYAYVWSEMYSRMSIIYLPTSMAKTCLHVHKN